MTVVRPAASVLAQRVRVAVLATLLAACALVIAMIVGGAAPASTPPGLPEPGRVTEWGLPLSRLVADLAGVATVGLLLVPTMLLPVRKSEIRGAAIDLVAATRWTAAIWAAAVVAQTLLTVSDLFAQPVVDLGLTEVQSFVFQISQGRALGLQAVLALVVALASRWIVSAAEATFLLVVALVALSPPVLTGHAASAGSHDLAVISLLVHILAVSLWVGGLVGLLWAAAAGAKRGGYAVTRFSTLAAWCVSIVAASGVVNATVRLGAWSPLFTSGYGRLVLAKTACLLGLAAIGYALILGLPDRRWGWMIGAVGAAWFALILIVAWWFKTEPIVPSGPPTLARPSSWPSADSIRWLIWAVLGVAALVIGYRQRRRSDLPRMLAGLAVASALGLAIGAIQLLPVAEAAARSARAASHNPLDIQRFSLEPYRIAELAWPNVFGTSMPVNRSWLLSLPPRDGHGDWVPSLYLGALTIVLAMVGFGGRDPGRTWLSGLVVLSLLASFGSFGGPLWFSRWFAPLTSMIGMHDPIGGRPRADGSLRDGVGSLYWLIATTMPGFDRFRYPSKLLTFASLGLAGLAGFGWDRLRTKWSRSASIMALLLVSLTVILLILTVIFRRALLDFWARSASPLPLSGPLDTLGALSELRRGLIQGGLVLTLAASLAWLGPRRPGWSGLVALLALTADLVLANAQLVWTIPAADRERSPRVLEIIRAAEARDPSPGPFRVHRMLTWHPPGWLSRSDPDRLRTVAAWERDTLQPEYALPLGLAYAMSPGAVWGHDYSWFFRPSMLPLGPLAAGMLGTVPGRPALLYPRRSFDLWTTRYFILPIDPGAWFDENRSYATFLNDVEMIYPPLDDFRKPGGRTRETRWRSSEDWQVFRNKAVYPRAWVVHDARFFKPLDDADEAERSRRMKAILHPGDPFWNEPGRGVHDPHQVAWIEVDPVPRSVINALPRTPPTPAESVAITRDDPQRVELTAALGRPGIVILADAFDPGWTLTIDGASAPIWRANRAMRGAFVQSGMHRLIFQYDPASFRIGAWITIAGLVALGGLGLATHWGLADRPTRGNRSNGR
jgi:putative copper export protein